MKKFLVVGQNSFLARRFKSLCSCKDSYQFISHDELSNSSILENVSCIINFALHPDYSKSAYAPEIDIDLKIASFIAEQPVHYVMISTRMVYDSRAFQACSEETKVEGLNVYGKNKLITEKHLATLLGDNLTILRVANFLGYEPPSNGHVSFLQKLVGSLKTSGKIFYDISPFVRKDFITDIAFTRILEKICEKNPTGIFNVGSGIPLPVGQIALWILTGYGSGELVITSPREYDEFFLNVEKVTRFAGSICTLEEIKDYCIHLGERIKHE